jgi:hypothetical protein
MSDNPELNAALTEYRTLFANPTPDNEPRRRALAKRVRFDLMGMAVHDAAIGALKAAAEVVRIRRILDEVGRGLTNVDDGFPLVDAIPTNPSDPSGYRAVAARWVRLGVVSEAEVDDILNGL